MVIRCVEIFAPPLVSPGCAIVAVDMVGDVCAACEVAMQSLVLGLALKSCAGMGKDGGPEVVPVFPPRRRFHRRQCCLGRFYVSKLIPR